MLLYVYVLVVVCLCCCYKYVGYGYELALESVIVTTFKGKGTTFFGNERKNRVIYLSKLYSFIYQTHILIVELPRRGR